MSCAVCHKGPEDGVTVYRVNEKGQPGLWACKDHMHCFASSMDDVPTPVRELVDIIEGRRRP